MKFHVPSFMLGALVGATTVAIGARLRPLAIEIGSAAIRLGDALAVRLARRREDLSDAWAEARARARPGPRRRGRPPHAWGSS